MDWFLTTTISNAIVASLLGCIAFVVGRFGRHALAHAIWVLMLLKLVTPPLVELPLHVIPAWAESPGPAAATSPPGSESITGVVDFARNPDARNSGEFHYDIALPVDALSPIPLLLIVWGVGGLVYLVRQLHVTMQMWKLMRHAAPSARIDRALHRVATTAELRNYPSARIAPWLGAPMLWGFGNQSVIVFPAELFDSLDDDAVASLLRHELAHYRRGDQWVRILQIIVSTVYWWHPLVWLAASEMEAAEEQCCDAWVIDQDVSSRRHYAEAILDTVDFLSDKPASSLPMAASGLGRVPLLERRLKAIMHGDEHGQITIRGRIAVLALSTILPVHPLLRPAHSAVPASTLTPAQDQVVHLATTDHSPQAKRVPYARAVSRDGQYAIAAFSGHRAELQVLRTNAVTRLDDRQVTCAAFSPDSDRSEFAIGTRDGVLELYDCHSGVLLQQLAAFPNPIESVAFSPDGQLLAVVFGEKDVHLIEVEEPENVRVLAAERPARCVRFSAEGNHLAVVADTPFGSDEPGHVDVWDLVSGESLFTVQCPSAIGVAEFGRDGTVVTAEWDGTLRHWSAAGEFHSTVQISKDAVSAAAFSADVESSKAFWNAVQNSPD